MAHSTLDALSANAEDATHPKKLKWFIGAYVPREIKAALQKEMEIEHRTLSQQLTHILTEYYERKKNNGNKKKSTKAPPQS